MGDMNADCCRHWWDHFPAFLCLFHIGDLVIQGLGLMLGIGCFTYLIDDWLMKFVNASKTVMLTTGANPPPTPPLFIRVANGDIIKVLGRPFAGLITVASCKV